ncbi:hypothetical protein BGZ63DRAFT_494952 [Mariannaea sp. PMI_226]|nr:hypothetical protein BGZ63DRAFT_494952 [Mariannaea sp. PMI_226]
MNDTPAGVVSDAGSQNTNPESAADILATGVFDRQPAADIGYFGPSSNHAFFRFLTTVITNLRVPDSHVYHDGMPSSTPAEPSALTLPERSLPSDQALAGRSEQGFPDTQTCIEWISRFFETVGSVLPYVKEVHLLREVNKMGGTVGYDAPQSRPTKALLNAVFAHALSTLDQGSPEPFYHRALGLLLVNEQTVGSWNLETVQALLLLGSYQQNTQRAMTSLSSHSLAVKVSYQLGLHSPSSYEHLAAEEKELRAIIWFAVTIGLAMDSIYGSNLELHIQLSSRSLTTKTIEYMEFLEHQWHQNEYFVTLGPMEDLESWTPEKLESEAHAILLSLYYYRTTMIVSAPALMMALEHATNDVVLDSSTIMRETLVSVLKRDWKAVTEFQKLLAAILRLSRPFLQHNAAWWLCNFTALTISLHGFAFWLICLHSSSLSVALNMSSSEVEMFLHNALEVLISVGGSSLLSAKAYECLKRYMPLVKTIVTDINDQNEILESSHDSVLQHEFLDFMFGSVDDVFRQLGENQFLGADVLSMEQTINYGSGGPMN